MHRGLQLGTITLTAQSAPAPAVVAIRRPDQLRAGAAVWVYFRGWRSGIVRRLVQRNARLANHGVPRGDLAVVQLDEQRASNLTVRRPVCELVLAIDDIPSSSDRQAAREFAREWWIEHERALAPSL